MACQINKISHLLTCNFKTLALEEKIKIKNDGPPRPALTLTQLEKTKTRQFTRHFSSDTYKKYAWMAGCGLNCFAFHVFSLAQKISPGQKQVTGI